MSCNPSAYTALCTALLASAALAQTLERSPVLVPADPASVDIQRPNTSAVAIVGETHTEIDDEPDFTPTLRAAAADSKVARNVEADPYVLAFLSGTFKPQIGVDQRLLDAMVANPGGETFGYIMIQGRLNHPAKVAQIEALGVEIYAPHTWQSFAARIPFHAVPRLQSLPFVRWVGYALPVQKIDPMLAAQIVAAAPQQRLAVHVSTFATDVNLASVWRSAGAAGAASPGNAIDEPVRTLIPNGPFHRALVALGFDLGHYTDTPNVHVFEGFATVAQIERIVALDFVSYVEPAQRHQLAHDQSQMMIGADRVRGTYHGQPITVGIIDSGIDSSPWHNDFGGKAMVGFRTGGTTAFDDGCEHGSHVAGTVFGSGVADARYRGTAPNCGNGGAGQRVFIGRYFFDACEPQGSVSSLYTSLGADYVEGAVTNLKPRCINNSWGAAPSTTQWSGTESGARTLDDVIQNNLQNYVFAAGNSGVGVGSPGSAKNALTVGSLDDFGTGTGNLSSFSRSGVSDSRQKPEVSAPGNVITSVDAGTTTGYRNDSGTSMAAPHVTGALTGLIQHYAFLDYSPPAQQVVAIACSEVEGRTVLSTTQGWGCINAYKMHWAGRTSWSVTTNHTHIDTTGEWFYVDIAIPAGIDALDVVWGWTEPAAASGATVARRSSIRVSVDAPPYSATGNTGEYTGFLGSNNKWKTVNLDVATFAGQTVRLKLYGDSVSGLCRVSGLLFWHVRDSQTPEPTLTINKSDDCVQPNATFTMTGNWAASATGDEFDNSRIWPVVTSFTVTQLQRTTADSVTQTYTGSTHASSPWPSLGSNGITTGQGTGRSAIWTLRAPATSNTYTLRVDGQADYRATATASATTTICVDGLPPNAPAGLGSSTHTTNVWSNNPSITFNWTPGTDNGCAGVVSQQYARGNASCPTPATSTAAGSNNRIESGLASVTAGNGYYFAVRSLDNCGNVGATACVGPYLIDTVVPSVSSVSINAGATFTTNLNVSVAVAAADSHSGVFEMRLSSNNSTWSAWQAFGSPVAYDLSANGGTTGEGTKTVFVQVRDRAGNVSTSGSDSIEYLRLPAISSSAPATLPNVTEGFFRLTGTDFVGVSEVQFDGTPITSTSPDTWHAGYFRVINDTTLDVYPPQAQATGGHTLRARNAAGLSNTQNVSLAFPASLVLRTHSTLTAGRPQTIFTSSGPNAGSWVSYLALSPSNLPSNLPGIVSFEIGANFSSLTLLSVGFPHNAGTRAATIGPFPTSASMVGASLFFEALTFVVPSLPLSTTDSWRTLYN